MQKVLTILKKPVTLLIIAVIVFFAAWLGFRPELLFVNKSVDEPLPGATHASLAAPHAAPRIAVGPS
jgi:hypothetical protein